MHCRRLLLIAHDLVLEQISSGELDEHDQNALDHAVWCAMADVMIAFAATSNRRTDGDQV